MVDFVLTSEECQAEKPSKQIFDTALATAKCSVPSAGACQRARGRSARGGWLFDVLALRTFATAYHIGDSVDIDVIGAAAAGWTPVRYNEHFDEDFPDWLDTDAVDKVRLFPVDARRPTTYIMRLLSRIH